MASLNQSTYSLVAGQEATLRTGHGTTDWFQIGKGVPSSVESSSTAQVPKSTAQQKNEKHSRKLQWG